MSNSWGDARVLALAKLLQQQSRVKKALYNIQPATSGRTRDQRNRQVERSLLKEKFRLEREVEAQMSYLTPSQIDQAKKEVKKAISRGRPLPEQTFHEVAEFNNAEDEEEEVVSNEEFMETAMQKRHDRLHDTQSSNMMLNLLPAPYRIQMMEVQLSARVRGRHRHSKTENMDELLDVMSHVDRKSMRTAIAGSTLFAPELNELKVKTAGLSLASLSRLKSVPLRCNLPDPCCICLDPLIVTQRASSLHCSHVFHTSCIRRWLERSKVCPLCKGPAFKQKLKPPLSQRAAHTATYLPSPAVSSLSNANRRNPHPPKRRTKRKITKKKKVTGRAVLRPLVVMGHSQRVV